VIQPANKLSIREATASVRGLCAVAMSGVTIKPMIAEARAIAEVRQRAIAIGLKTADNSPENAESPDALKLRSLTAGGGSGLPEAKGYIAQKESHTVDYRDTESLRVRQRIDQPVRNVDG
jgi:hypothetical protein